MKDLIQTLFISSSSLRELLLDFSECSLISKIEMFELARALKKLPCLTKLSLNFQGCSKLDNASLRELSQSLSHMPSLTSLSLNFWGCISITNIGISDLSQLLSMLSTSLTKLYLNFEDCRSITTFGFCTLFHSIKSLSSLAEFEFESSKMRTEDDALKVLAQTLNKLSSSLRNLKIRSYYCNTISDEGMFELYKSIRHLSRLEKLFIDFSFCERLSDLSLNCLFESIKNISSLRYLTVKLGMTNLIDGNYSSKLPQALKQLLPNLTSLSLIHRESPLESDDIRNVFISLKESSLKNLTLNLYKGNGLTQVEMGELAQSLGTLTSLQKLCLNFKECFSNGDEIIGILSDSLVNLLALNELDINFADYKNSTSDVGLCKLAGSLHKLSLTNLSLDFEGCNIRDVGMKELSLALKNFSSLASLSLKFYRCYKISDTGISEIAQALGDFTIMRKIWLDFSHCSLISDIGLSELCQSLNKFVALEELHLTFYECELMSEEGLCNLDIGKFSKLTKLYLGFFNCEDMRDDAVCRLARSISKLDYIESLNFNFCNCSKLTNAGMKILENFMKKSSKRFVYFKVWIDHFYLTKSGKNF